MRVDSTNVVMLIMMEVVMLMMLEDLSVGLPMQSRPSQFCVEDCTKIDLGIRRC